MENQNQTSVQLTPSMPLRSGIQKFPMLGLRGIDQPRNKDGPVIPAGAQQGALRRTWGLTGLSTPKSPLNDPQGPNASFLRPDVGGLHQLGVKSYRPSQPECFPNSFVLDLPFPRPSPADRSGNGFNVADRTPTEGSRRSSIRDGDARATGRAGSSEQRYWTAVQRGAKREKARGFGLHPIRPPRPQVVRKWCVASGGPPFLSGPWKTRFHLYK